MFTVFDMIQYDGSLDPATTPSAGPLERKIFFTDLLLSWPLFLGNTRLIFTYETPFLHSVSGLADVEFVRPQIRQADQMPC